MYNRIFRNHNQNSPTSWPATLKPLNYWLQNHTYTTRSITCIKYGDVTSIVFDLLCRTRHE